ncbi:MAG TPA: ZIP family metal transporter [Candidatus Obscuribacterales bacterium]
MATPWIYAIASVLAVSLVSLIGLVTMSLDKERLKKATPLLVSLAAGAMFGNAFIHLLPEAFEGAGNSLVVSLSVLGGIFAFFVLEKVLLWRHCHSLDHCSSSQHCHDADHVHPVGYMSLLADGLENLVDGMVIGAAYMVSIPVGIATTLAVVLHEVPTEMADFGVLMHAGFSRARAVAMNLASSLIGLVGAVIALWAGSAIENFPVLMAPVAAGCFIYLAGSDLLPQMHKELRPSRSLLQLLAMGFGVAVMLLLALCE